MSTAQAADLAPLIEHTALKPETTPAAIAQLCDEAIRLGLRGVCVNPVYVAMARRRLDGATARPLVVSVVGFPLGANLTATKAAETRAVIDAGADEVDMVLPIGRLKAGELGRGRRRHRRGRRRGRRQAGKVILETLLLDEREKIAGVPAVGARRRGVREDVDRLRRLARHRRGRRADAADGRRPAAHQGLGRHPRLRRARGRWSRRARDVLGCSASVAILGGMTWARMRSIARSIAGSIGSRPAATAT